MKMQIILVFKECFNILCIKPWHHSEGSASACQGNKNIYHEIIIFFLKPLYSSKKFKLNEYTVIQLFKLKKKTNL